MNNKTDNNCYLQHIACNIIEVTIQGMQSRYNPDYYTKGVEAARNFSKCDQKKVIQAAIANTVFKIDAVIIRA